MMYTDLQFHETVGQPDQILFANENDEKKTVQVSLNNCILLQDSNRKIHKEMAKFQSIIDFRCIFVQSNQISLY